MKQIDIKELANLLRDSYKLNCLEAGGVDNWDGYDYSLNNEEDISYLKQSDKELTKDYQSSNILELFTKLPSLRKDERDNLVPDGYYSPMLYHEKGSWYINWYDTEDLIDSAYIVDGNTPEEAIQKAYEWCLINGYIND